MSDIDYILHNILYQKLKRDLQKIIRGQFTMDIHVRINLSLREIENLFSRIKRGINEKSQFSNQ
jgi:hypothetical protein